MGSGNLNYEVIDDKGKDAGRLTRTPGDVATAMSGKTIEVINADAEGRPPEGGSATLRSQ